MDPRWFPKSLDHPKCVVLPLWWSSCSAAAAPEGRWSSTIRPDGQGFWEVSTQAPTEKKAQPEAHTAQEHPAPTLTKVQKQSFKKASNIFDLKQMGQKTRVQKKRVSKTGVLKKRIQTKGSQKQGKLKRANNTSGIPLRGAKIVRTTIHRVSV